MEKNNWLYNGRLRGSVVTYLIELLMEDEEKKDWGIWCLCAEICILYTIGVDYFLCLGYTLTKMTMGMLIPKIISSIEFFRITEYPSGK